MKGKNAYKVSTNTPTQRVVKSKEINQLKEYWKENEASNLSNDEKNKYRSEMTNQYLVEIGYLS